MAKVYVGMSGGVDSSLAAALLKESGHEVTGVFIRVWESFQGSRCLWREERDWALRAAVSIGIPLETLDLSREYEEEVVKRMLEDYTRGRTPNPDIWCNRAVKFGAFWDYAHSHGAEYLATGHYVQTDGEHLFFSVDNEKDQSYFLWTLTREDLSHTLFPIGKMNKREVRAEAERRGLPNAGKKDSQGICFIGDIDVKDFLRERISVSDGVVLDEAGRVIGHHPGALLFTLGERHGFTVTDKTPYDTPLFVIAKDIKKNTLTVSSMPLQSHHAVKEITLEAVNWVDEPPRIGNSYHARLRHRGTLTEVRLQSCGDETSVTFLEPVLVAPGQSCVLYDKDRCLGGGIVM